jgi:hypothetical protein
MPSAMPSQKPSLLPSMVPSSVPSLYPSSTPSQNPSSEPSSLPSSVPSFMPSVVPSQKPSLLPSMVPSSVPSLDPSITPSAGSAEPSVQTTSLQPTVCIEPDVCSCEPNDPTIRTWKCGNSIYICPDPSNESIPFVSDLCNNQVGGAKYWYLLTSVQCDEMLAIQLGGEGDETNRVCIALPQYCVEAKQELSDRVCYTDCVTFKVDSTCGSCNSNVGYTLTPYESCEPTAAPL